MDSRKYFVDQVASTILENHNAQEADSFIFGISGKWGEGKTRFLQDLEKEIQKRDSTYKILWINPWKFASDKISFLRSFLTQLPNSKSGRFNSIRSFFRNPTELSDLYFDVSKDVIDWRILLLLGLYLLNGFIYYFFWKDLAYINYFVPLLPSRALTFFKLLGASFLIPIALAVFKSISTYQQGSKTISTVDRFEELLKLRLEQNKGTKFLVYIDDLDRVTPTVARDVLDNLRTFFDKPQLSFIVAGDHTVLERYIGRELLPGDNQSPAQLEEGRRYLKKIFNVYWRLPPPIPSELNKFLEDDLFVGAKADLDKIFTGDDASENLKKFGSILARYFEGNFRQIIRFFEMVRFTFQIIEMKRASVPADEKPYFEELIKYPLLVIRILMIQENCTPLFEAVLRDPEILRSLEDSVENKDSGKVQEILNKFTGKFSENQRAFIEKFIYEEPRFYKDSGLAVTNLQPFLVLAADSSFGDGRGPTPEKFMEIINRGDSESIRKSVLSSGETRLKEASNNFVAEYSAQPMGAQQNPLIRTLVTALREIPSSHNSHEIFAEKLQNLDFSFASSLAGNERIITYRLIWSWLDSIENVSYQTSFAGKFPPASIDDLNIIQLDSVVGSFTTSRIVQWFREYYPAQKTDSYNRLLANADYLDQETLAIEIQPLDNEIIEDLAQNREGTRDLAYRVMLRTGRFDDMKKRLLQRAEDTDQDFWTWILGKEISALSLTQGLLEDAVISKIDRSPSDLSSLFNVINFAASNSFSNSSKLWQKIISVGFDTFFMNLVNFVSTPLIQITPDKTHARSLYSVALKKIITLDESLQPQYIRILRNGVWLWKNLDKPQESKILESLCKSPNADISREATEVLESWK